jgi:rhodanese-related sulfurtransferase
MRRYARSWMSTSTAAVGLLFLPMVHGCTPAASPEVQNVTPLEAQSLIQSHEGDANFVIVDVRSPAEFAGGHLANAVNVCYLCTSPAFRDAIAELDKSRTYLVYCCTEHRSPLACDFMLEEGFTNLYNITGGLFQWTAENLPIVQ